MRNIRANNVDVRDSTWRIHLAEYFQEFKEVFPDIVLSAEWKENHTQGLEASKLAYAQVVNARMLSKGFLYTGQH